MFNRSLLLTLAGLAATMAAPYASADLEDRLYDFTDSFYRRNGVNPSAIAGRRQAVAPLAVQDSPIFWYQRDVRALFTLPSYDHSGGIWYFTVFGGLNDQGFTADAAGARAKYIADRSIEYVFPKRGFDPLGLANGRQSNLLDMRNGYFSNNPLGLWVHVWVNFTDKAFTTYGQYQLEELRRRNGTAADGTPIIRTVGEIDDLHKMGMVSKRKRLPSDPAYYAICPVIKDPTDGGIATDQWLSYPKRDNGAPVEPKMLRNFEELRLNGRWYSK